MAQASLAQVVDPAAALDIVPEIPRRPRSFTVDDAAMLFGSGLSAYCFTWLLYYRLTALEGLLGFWLCWFAAFTGIHWMVARSRLGRVAAADRVAAIVISTAGLALVMPLVLVVGYTLSKGLPALRPRFFVETQATTAALSAATEGGGAHAIVGTLEQVGLAMLMSVPLGITTAVFLNEVGGRLARPVRTIVDAMSAVPSIVAGLFIYAVFILSFGGEQSGFAAALALAVLMLPTVTRTAEVVLRLVPGGLREASFALGASEWSTVRRVVLPTARSGLITATVLGVARTVGETAPLLLTAGGAFTMKWNPFAGAQDALPFFVYRLIAFPQEAQKQRAWTGALVLISIVLVLFVVARVVGGRTPGRPRRRGLTRKGSV